MADGLTAKEPEPISVPSGQPILLQEVISDAAGYGLTMRFRFTAPDLAAMLANLSYEELESDMAHLCLTYALPRLSTQGPEAAMVVISLAEREVPFGEAAPDVAQVFEAYRPEDGTCVWEGF